jgi:DNA polymerase III subunit delta
MKLSPRDASGYFARPDRDKTGILIYGEDAMRVALKRQELIAALIGPEGENEMRLTRIQAAELRKEPALLGDAIKEVGFFPGQRVAFVEDANDTVVNPVAAALEDWRSGDAQIVVTGGQLPAKSALRKLFEGHSNAYAAALYNDPPSRAEIEAELTRAGLARPDGAAMEMLTALSRDLDPGDFRQTLEKISLYKLGDATPLTPAEVRLSAPGSTEADLDDVLNIVAEGRIGEIGPVMSRLEAQGMAAVTLLIMATRHFRALHTAASDPGGVGQGMGRLRPPVFGPRRDRMSRQSSDWGMFKLEQALQMLLETDLSLRSAGQHGPALAIVERSFIRLAMLGRR